MQRPTSALFFSRIPSSLESRGFIYPTEAPTKFQVLGQLQPLCARAGLNPPSRHPRTTKINPYPHLHSFRRSSLSSSLVGRDLALVWCKYERACCSRALIATKCLLTRLCRAQQGTIITEGRVRFSAHLTRKAYINTLRKISRQAR